MGRTFTHVIDCWTIKQLMNYKGLVMTKQDNEIAEKRRKESYPKYNHSEGRATQKKWVESNQERLKKSSEKYGKLKKESGLLGTSL